MKHQMGVLVLAALLGPWGCTTAWAQDETLVVVQDEISMQQVIARYLRTSHQLTVNERPQANDLWLDLPMKGDPMPPYKFVIGTQSLNRDHDTKAVIERGVLIKLETHVMVPEARRVALLNMINTWNKQKVFCCAYIDTDRELIFDWCLNVLSNGLPTENVFDVVAREDKLWREFYPAVASALN